MAGDLEIGDRIMNLDLEYGTVDSIQIVLQIQVMYDLTVDQAHTFYVGAGDWLVHNVDCKRLNTNVAHAGEMMREVYTELSNAPKDAAVRTEMMSDFAKQIKEAADNNGWGQWNANEFPLVDAAGNPTGGAIFIGDGAQTQAIVIKPDGEWGRVNFGGRISWFGASVNADTLIEVKIGSQGAGVTINWDNYNPDKSG